MIETPEEAAVAARLIQRFTGQGSITEASVAGGYFIQIGRDPLNAIDSWKDLASWLIYWSNTAAGKDYLARTFGGRSTVNLESVQNLS